MFATKPKEETLPITSKPLSAYNYDELARLKIEVDNELAARGTIELDSLREKILTIAAATGIPVDALFGTRKAEKKRKPKPKYRNPDDPQQTWSGRGNPPAWLQEKLDAGATKEDFAVA